MAIFARPDTTAQVLDRVRAARPERLLVFADAPRPEVPGEEERCAATRKVIEGVDWECSVETRFAEEHLGNRLGIARGIDWVFSRTEEAILLEDDCVPDPTFFRFCEELLERYREDERVMAISGNDFRLPAEREASYGFSRYPLIWGWATWRRAWAHYDPAMRAWPRLRDRGWLSQRFEDPHAVSYWNHVFESAYAGLDTWDYAWVLSCWLRDGLTAIPSRNLVSNVGFREDATHTRQSAEQSRFAALPTSPMEFPLRHPPEVRLDERLDRFLEDAVFGGNLRRVFERLRAARNIRDRAER